MIHCATSGATNVLPAPLSVVPDCARLRGAGRAGRDDRESTAAATASADLRMKLPVLRHRVSLLLWGSTAKVRPALETGGIRGCSEVVTEW